LHQQYKNLIITMIMWYCNCLCSSVVTTVCSKRASISRMMQLLASYVWRSHLGCARRRKRWKNFEGEWNHASTSSSYLQHFPITAKLLPKRFVFVTPDVDPPLSPSFRTSRLRNVCRKCYNGLFNGHLW
jgi:hypothetical protein